MRNVVRQIIAVVFCHWLSTIGVVLTSGAAIVFIGFQFLRYDNPYYALIIFLVVPAFFVFGLVLVPIGVYLRARTEGGFLAALEAVRWDDERLVRLALVVTAATLLNVTLMSAASYRGLEYLDSTEFCGAICHTPMRPHFEAHQVSPHAEVACVECHVGPGPSSFLTAKLGGLGRVIELAGGSYPKPLRISDENRMPVARACEGCHSREYTHGESLRLIRHYDNDLESTPRTTVLLLPVDTGIHGTHVGRDIEYIASDPERQTIPWVSVDGIDYVAGEVPEGPTQTMDCLDCHNRVAHSFGSAELAVDEAIADGRIDRLLPFAKRDALEAVLGNTDNEDASPAVAEILRRNVFPVMDITWDSYPDNIGHERYPGCFRCHDGQHRSSSGETLSQDCFACHQMIAVREQEPAILDQLGIAP